MQCPSIDDVMQYLDEDLPPERMAEMRGHLASCKRCTEEFRDLVDFDEELRTAWKVSLSKVLPTDFGKSGTTHRDEHRIHSIVQGIAGAVIKTVAPRKKMELEEDLPSIIREVSSRLKSGKSRESADPAAAIGPSSGESDIVLDTVLLSYVFASIWISAPSKTQALRKKAEELKKQGWSARLIDEIVRALRSINA